MNMLDGKAILITGGARGIGMACAQAAVREGAAVLLADLDEDDGQAAAASLREGGATAEFVTADVSDPADCERMVRTAVERLGRLDVAVNNAGIAGEQAPVGDKSLDDWNRVISVNLTGVFLCCKAELDVMTDQGDGVIVNMASILGQVGFPNASAYVAAKHGVVGLTKNLALEYGAQGVRAVAVGPAFVRTPLLEENLEQEQLDQLVGAHPQGRLGEAEEVAQLVAWLASPRASFVNGGYFPVDGGYLAQ